MQKVSASSVVGLPFFGVGALLTASLGLAMCEWNWEHKDQPGICARCGCQWDNLSSQYHEWQAKMFAGKDSEDPPENIPTELLPREL